MKLTRVIYMSALLFAGSAVLTGCGEAKFKVNGEIAGGEDKTVFLEKSDFHGRWFVLDSVKVASSGKFEIKSAAPASPEIYRLSLDGRFIYFPVDSIETLNIVSPADKFGTEFEISGTEQAANMASFEKELMALDATDEAKREEFKRNVYGKYLKDSQGGIIGYYVLTKIVDGKPLYDPQNTSDARYYAAVATGFEHYRPNDPHTGMLRDVSLAGMRKKNSESGKTRVVEAEEISLIDIDLQNTEGKNVKLSDVAGKGKKTVVVFGLMNEPESPALNMALSDLYSQKGGAVEFYQVSFDPDRYAWRDGARNLKWINVIDPDGMTSDVIRQYNIGNLPVFFIYSSDGQLIDKAESMDELRKKL